MNPIVNFLDKLNAAQTHNHSWLCLSLDVQIKKMPLPMARIDDPMFPFARSIVDATRDLVCAYQLDPGFFWSEGAAGMIALERIVRYIPANVPLILDGKFGDLGRSAEQYARGAFEAYQADAVTFSLQPDQYVVERFLKYPDKAVFLSTSGRISLPEVAAQAAAWNAQFAGACGLIAEAEELACLRSAAAEIVCAVSVAGMTDAAIGVIAEYGPTTGGLGPIVTAGSSPLYASRHDNFAEAAREAALGLRDRIHGIHKP